MKFGSYDPEGFEEPSDMKLLKTENSKSWAVKADIITFEHDKTGQN